MIISLYSYTIILIGVAIYIIKPKWVMIYWLILLPIVFPIINIGLLILDREVFQTMMAVTYNSLRNLFLILILIELCKRKFRIPALGSIYAGILAIALYMLFHSIIHHPNSINVWPKTSEVISLVLPLIFLTMRRDLCPCVETLYKVIGVILGLQIIGFAIDLSGNHVYPTFYIPYVTILANGTSYDDSVFEGMNMGTFPSATLLADFLSFIYLFITLEYFSNNRFSTRTFYLLTLLIGIFIVFTGIRVALFLFFLAFFISSLLYIKRHIKTFVIASSLSIAILLFLMSFDISSAKFFSDNDGLNRQIEGVASFLQSKKDKEDDHSTFRLTSYLIENYFIDGILFGNGRENMGEFAYGNSGNVTLENFINDAKLAYILVEFGLLGIFAYFFFYNSIFNFLKKEISFSERKKLTVCFAFYILMTLVDAGLFDRLVFPLIYLYGFSVLSYPISVSCDLNRFK